jgi:photosystem II stability/assembly factor-like uncharacterized protein
MKYLKLFAVAIMMVLTANIYSQWTFCAGSTQMTGLGTNPGIYCLDGNNAIVVGGVTGAPKVYKTTNGGVNFINITANITGPELYAGCMMDANTLLVGDGAGNAKLWRSTDGGTSWTTVLTTGGTGGFFNGIVKANLTANFVVAQSDAPTGSNCVMYVSTNAGATWTAQTQNPSFAVGSLPSVFCIDNQFYGNGSSGVTPVRLAWTANGGVLWTTTQTPGITGNFMSGLAFNDNKLNGLAVSSASFPTLVRTSTGPAGPWTTVSAGTGTSTLNVLRWAPGTSICFLATSATTGAIRMTTDNGATWVNQTTNGLTGFFDISVQNNGGIVNGYAVAGDGSVVKYSQPVGLNGNNTTTPTKFVLEQNYPNPFNPATTINYSVPVAGNVTVKVYNTLGIEVMTIVNKNHTVGNYTEAVDMSSFSSGVYFYTLTAGDFKETRKMMLIK